MFDFELIYQIGVPIVFLFAVVIFFALFYVNAPYGRHWRSSWGPSLKPRLAWVLMELPCVAVFTWIYFQGVRAGQLIPFVLFIVWQLHYVQRTFVYPALMHPRGPLCLSH